jgi:phage-related tail fiber protein
MLPTARLRLTNYPYSALSKLTYNQGEIVYDETNATLRLLDGVTQGGIALANQSWTSAYVAGVQASLTTTLQNYTNSQISAINRTLSVTGDATGVGTINAITLTLANTGVAVGSYAAVTVNAKGQVTGASALTVTGDATGVSSGAGLALTLAASGVQAGSYTGSVTVNSKGIVTAAAQLTSGNVTTALGYTPFNPQGGTISGAVNITGAVTVTANPTLPNQVVNKAYIDSKIWLALAVGL